jgi:cytochrome c-type biogenesis protein CcmF
MFSLGAFVLAVVAQEFWRGVRARRAMSMDSIPVAMVSLVRRNRRRYGGYLVHAGIVVMLMGVAASSTFQHVTDARLAPGDRIGVGGYEIQYVRPTSDVDVARNGSLEKINLGADLRVRRGDDKPKLVHTERSYFPTTGPGLGIVSRYFEGESTSEVGLRPGLLRDFWATVAPDIKALEPTIKRGDAVFKRAQSLRPEARAAALGVALRELTASYPRSAPPATFRVLVSPLISWLWLGALIVFAGGLITIWPAPAGAPRRVTATRAARLAREPGRA